MSEKIIISFLLLILIILISFVLFEYFYLEPIRTEVRISFQKDHYQSSALYPNPPLSKHEITISFKYPISEKYFLENFKIIPYIKGKIIFEDYYPPSTLLSRHPALKRKMPIFSKRIRFLPEKINYDQTYKVKIFEKEFSFSLPSPKPKEIFFNEERKKILISFFEPIEEEYFFKKLKLEPEIEGKYIFNESRDEITFLPESIEMDKDYRIEILGKELSFKIESPKTKEIFFDKKREEIVMTFSKPIEKDYFFENFSIKPKISGEVVFNKDKNKAIFRSKYIQRGKNYKVRILDKHLSFKIDLPSPKPEPKPSSPPTKVAREGGKVIKINLSNQTLYLFEESSIAAKYIISSGKPGMRTPTGTFKVSSKEKNHWSATYGLYMPYSLKLYNGYYIHELPYWPGGYREGEEHLGRPVSHGCVRLGVGAAKNVYDFADIGTKVIIYH